MSECYIGVRSATASISLKIWIVVLSNRKLSGCFSGSTALDMMQRERVVVGSHSLVRCSRAGSANVGDEVVQVLLFGFEP